MFETGLWNFSRGVPPPLRDLEIPELSALPAETPLLVGRLRGHRIIFIGEVHREPPYLLLKEALIARASRRALVLAIESLWRHSEEETRYTLRTLRVDPGYIFGIEDPWVATFDEVTAVYAESNVMRVEDAGDLIEVFFNKPLIEKIVDLLQTMGRASRLLPEVSRALKIMRGPLNTPFLDKVMRLDPWGDLPAQIADDSLLRDLNLWCDMTSDLVLLMGPTGAGHPIRRRLYRTWRQISSQSPMKVFELQLDLIDLKGRSTSWVETLSDIARATPPHLDIWASVGRDHIRDLTRLFRISPRRRSS